MEGFPNLFRGVRPFDHWEKGKDQQQLLFIRKAPTPLARWRPPQRKLRTRSRTAGTGEGAEKDVLAEGFRIFRKRRREKESAGSTAQWCAAIATCAQARTC